MLGTTRTFLRVRKQGLDVIHQVPHARRHAPRREHEDPLFVAPNLGLCTIRRIFQPAFLVRRRLALQRRMVHGRHAGETGRTLSADIFLAST